MRGRSRWTWFAVVMVLGMAFLWLGQSDVARASELGVQTEGSTVVGYDGEGGAVRIPDGITTISSNAFKGNNSITSVDLNEVTAIGSGAFQDSSLSSVSNMDGVIEVGDSAFANTKLKTITLPQTLKTLSQNAFRNTLLTSIEGGSLNNFQTYNGALYIRQDDGFALYIVPEGIGSSLELAPNTVAILKDSLYGASQLTSLKVPGSVRNMDLSGSNFVQGGTGTLHVVGGSYAEQYALQNHVDYDLSSGSPSRVTGKVVDTSGNAVSGATITVSPDTRQSKDTVTTDGNGGYTLTGLSVLDSGTYTIRATKDGSSNTATLDYKGENSYEVATIELPSEADNAGTYSISGVVVDEDDDDEPISGATILISPDTRTNKVAIRTDSNGVFTITGLTNGRYIVRAIKDGVSEAREVVVNGQNVGIAEIYLSMDEDDDDDEDEEAADTEDDLRNQDEEFDVDDDEEEPEEPADTGEQLNDVQELPTDGSGYSSVNHSLDTTPKTADGDIDPRLVFCIALFMIGLAGVLYARARGSVVKISRQHRDAEDNDDLD